MCAVISVGAWLYLVTRAYDRLKSISIQVDKIARFKDRDFDDMEEAITKLRSDRMLEIFNKLKESENNIRELVYSITGQNGK